MEYQRQQLAVTINQIREKRPSMVPVAATRENRPNAVPAATKRTERVAPKITPPPMKKAVKDSGKTGEIASNYETLAQQITDWPQRQPAPRNPVMQFDASVIENFLQHAARFVLRHDPNAREAEVEQLMRAQVTWISGRDENPPSRMELAARTLQTWQYRHEQGMWLENTGNRLNAPSPRNVAIQARPYEESQRSATSVRADMLALAPSRQVATLEEISDDPADRMFVFPAILPAFQWVLRISYPPTETIEAGGGEGNISEVTYDGRLLSNGISVRRDGGMLEFNGPPTGDVSMSLGYTDQMVRLRLCSTYVIIEERYRLDINGVSEVLKNEQELARVPNWEINFLGVDFKTTRVRFSESRARLQLVDQELILAGVGDVAA